MKRNSKIPSHSEVIAGGNSTFPSPFLGLRELYRPLQPTITDKDNNVIYIEHLPAQDLKPFIYCYWELKSRTDLHNSFTYRVVSDGCIDIFFNRHQTSESFVMGFCKRYTEFGLGTSFHYAGIRFLPTMFSQIFGVPACSLSNQCKELNSVLPKVAAFLRAYLEPLVRFEDLMSVLNHFLIEQVDAAIIDADPRFYHAIQQIIVRRGGINIERDIDTGLSTRQLRRLFDYYIGASMKSFSKVIRFQNTLSAQHSETSRMHNQLFIDTGYYDQAHFIKEFRNFYGVTPSKALGRKS